MSTPKGQGSRNFGVEGFGLFTLDIEIEAETRLNLDTVPLHVVKKAETQTVIRQVKIKNVSTGLVTLNRLSNVPKALRRFPAVLRIGPRMTATIAVEAYDPEQIRSLRNALIILVDPVR